MAQDGRMLIRMLGVQTAQSFILNRKNLKLGFKILTVFLIFLALLAYDLHHFFKCKSIFYKFYSEDEKPIRVAGHLKKRY